MNHRSLLTLLLIDDCAEDRVIFRHFLQHDSLYTYRIVEFETVTEAIEWCQQEIPDVILLDYLLPDADGLEFLELVRGELGNDQSAVIMLTGQGDEIIAVRAMKRGAQEYLIKNTLTPEILQGAIRHAVEEMHLIKQLQQSQEQQQLMASIALRIRQSLQLQEILTATATEVRQFLQADRVVVYQFHPDMSGTVVAESVLGGWRVSLGTQIQDTCFQQGAGADYHLGKKRAIDNIYQAGLTECHLQLLEEFEVKANLVVPILVNNQLWGLLIAHQCRAQRHWQTVELDLLEQLGVQIAIAIQQASAYEQLQAELAERQRAQESLQESEERFRCTFEQAAVGISHVSLNGQFIRLNQRFCEIAGYPQAELQRLTFQEITHPDDLAADLEQQQKLLAGEIDTYSIEKRYRRKDGQFVWINLTVSLVRDRTGQPKYFISVIQDITDRIHAEQALHQLNQELETRVEQRTQALRESEERWQLALRGSNDGIWDWNVKTNQVFYSTRWKEMRGFTADEISSSQEEWSSRIHPEDYQRVMQAFTDHCGQKTPFFKAEYRVQRKDGAYIWVLDRGQALWDEAGNVIRVTGSEKDITDRKQAEEQLRNLSDRLTLALKAGAIGIWDWDMLHEAQWDDRMYELYDIQRSDSIATYQSWLNSLHPEDRPVAEAALEAAVRGEKEFDTEFRIIHKDGSIHFIKAAAILQRNEQGEPKRMVGINYDITERKKIEAALRESERRYATLTEAAPVAIFRFDSAGNCVYVNDYWSKMTGRPTKAALGMGWVETLHPDDSDRLLREWTEEFARGGFFQTEARFLHQNGRIVCFFCQALPETDADGRMIGYVGTLTDITERKQVESALRESEHRYATLTATAPVAIFRFDNAGNCIYVNDYWSKMTGRPTQAALGRGWIETLHPDDRDYILADVERRYQPETDDAKQEFHGEGRQMRPDGSINYFYIQILSESDPSGKIIGHIGTLTDITERKLAEEALAKYVREVEDLYDNAPCGYHSLDGSGRFVKVNETELQLLGYSREEMIGKPIVNFFTEASRLAFLENYPQFKAQGWSKDLEYEMICKDGTVLPVLISATAVKDEDGNYLYNRATLFDIRDRKQTEAKLRQTNEQLCQTNAQLARVTRLKDEFLANMSHELRTPLNAILGMSEGLNEGVFGDINERQKKAISTIERSGKHLLELINDILDLSKIESGKVELQLSQVSVRSVCDASLAFVRQMALKKNIRLSTRIPEHLGSIQADERRLRQVLINLLSNAIKFTPEAGSVSLEVRLETPENPINPPTSPSPHPPTSPSPHPPTSPSPHPPTSPFPLLTLSVTDTGIGISAEDLKKLFQPFVQVDSSLNRQYEGTGLGLALVQRIVALHQGTVSVISEPGKGSCFTFRIPYLTSDNFPKIEQTLPLPSHCLPKENAQVLIIEDSTPAYEQITRYLQEMGMQPIVYPRGEGAAKEVERLLPALVILDLQLPNLSGWEILHQIKTNPHTQEIPVVIISVIDERTTGLAQGAFEYLVKPIRRDQLQQVIKKLQSPHCYDFAQEIVLPKPQDKSPLILLAEDNQANIDTMSGYLECRGYRLVLAKNGQQAIDIALAQRPDLIVMDIQMPVMDGLEAIRYIRQKQQFSKVPIIALTALAMPGDRETCLCAGANEYLSKPIKLKQLVATIQQLLQR